MTAALSDAEIITALCASGMLRKDAILRLKARDKALVDIAARTDQSALIKISQLQTMLGMKSRQAIYDRLHQDPSFPRPVKLANYSIAWRLSEVRQYVENLPRAELTGLSGPDQRMFDAAAKKGPK